MNDKNLVMIVDDDKFLLDMYKKKFESKGIMVEVATGSEEALNQLRKGIEPDALDRWAGSIVAVSKVVARPVVVEGVVEV